QHGHEENLEKPQKEIKKKAPAKAVKEAKTKEQTDKQADTNLDIEALIKTAPKSSLLKNIKPMKATLVDEPFDDPDWLYEVKWDGYRAIAFINKGEVELLSRNNLRFDKFYPINKTLEKWKFNTVIDGEILVLNDKGMSN